MLVFRLPFDFVSSAVRFLFLYWTWFMVKNVLSHTYVLAKSAFLVKSLSLLTNF